MKLATYKDGSRDGQLLVVSRDLSTAHYATGIANHLQQVLDDWNFLSPLLQDLSHTLNQGKARHAFPFDPALCMAPLPRAHVWAQGSAYTGEPGPRNVATPRLGRSDDFVGAMDSLPCVDEAWGLDFEAGWAVVTGDLPAACTPQRALEGVRLLMLVNDAVLRAHPADGLGRPATSFSPVAVTPDELGDAWMAGRLLLNLHCRLNGRRLGVWEATLQTFPHVGELVARLAGDRRLRAGAIVGAGPVGTAGGVYLKPGDVLRLEVKGRDGLGIFGAIEQTVSALL
jgi:fumarylacetoacetate (FAA) hydrolase